MTRTDFLTALEEATMAAPGSLTGEGSLETLKNWDSMAVVVLIAHVDERFSVSLSDADISVCRTANDLADLVGSKIKVDVQASSG